MPKLDVRGIIAAAQLAAYVPIAAISLLLVIQYGLRRDAGWLFLFIFSLVRIAGGALIVAAELVQPTKPDLFLAAYILQPAGVGVLFLSLIGFVGLAGYHTYSDVKRTMEMLRVFGVFSLIMLVLHIIGGVLGSQVSPNTGSVGTILRRIGAGGYGILWTLLFLSLFVCWRYRHAMRSYRRKLLIGITLAHPFLGIRVAYAIMAAFSSSDLFGTMPSSNPILAKMNPITGEWVFFLVLGEIAEFLVAFFYVLFGTILSRRRH